VLATILYTPYTFKSKHFNHIWKMINYNILFATRFFLFLEDKFPQNIRSKVVTAIANAIKINKTKTNSSTTIFK
jgi:hypothetical protein